MLQRYFLSVLIIMFFTCHLSAQRDIPAVYSNLNRDVDGRLYLKKGDKEIPVYQDEPLWRLDSLTGNPQGTNSGIYFNFNDKNLSGELVFGLIKYGDSNHPQPVFFHTPAKILHGVAMINIKYQLKGRYDMSNWEKRGKGTLGYRVINSKGKMLYDGRVSFLFDGNTFTVDTTVIEGPFVNCVTPEGCIISFTTNEPIKAAVETGGKIFYDDKAASRHEIKISGLDPATKYMYRVICGNRAMEFSFKTAPKNGSRKPFTFAYTSDSREGQGGGERSFFGVNSYIMRKMMALATQQNIAFMQFSGDLINGYLCNKGETNLQYANWKRTVEPYNHYFPVYTTMGNHEALVYKFFDTQDHSKYYIDKFPFETESSERVFADNFVNPENGPDSEDGSKYDPKKRTTDFPSYKENVYYYMYDNVAVVVLNSNYWYAPTVKNDSITSGNLHGYIMDNQLEWLRTSMDNLEADDNIDHIFITQHTPAFPNGGHVADDMWYRGSNKPRPFINGKPVEKGIIERRDQYLDIIVNQSDKTLAILTGDEHNFNVTTLTPKTTIYPENYKAEKISLKRIMYQVNNGAAGAPYYAQEETPWTDDVSGFTTQNALVLFDINGTKVSMRVLNPDTLEEIKTMTLRE